MNYTLKRLYNGIFYVTLIIIQWPLTFSVEEGGDITSLQVNGQNENCTRHEDCNEKLLCINGICRKPILHDEIRASVKVCLGITIITVIMAVFSSLIKCIIKYYNFPGSQGQNDVSNLNSTFNRSELRPGPVLEEVREEKPPSYEECILSNDPPPSYVVSTSPIAMTTESSKIHPINLLPVNRPNGTTFNIHPVNKKMNSM